MADKGHPKDWQRDYDNGNLSLSVQSFLMGSKAMPCTHGTAVAHLLSALFGVGAGPSHLGRTIFRSLLSRVMMRNS